MILYLNSFIDSAIFDHILSTSLKIGLNWVLLAFIYFGQSNDEVRVTNEDKTLGTTTKIRQTSADRTILIGKWLFDERLSVVGIKHAEFAANK